MLKSKNVKIIAVVGMAGAGKGESCAFFAKKGIPILRLGDQTDIGLKKLGMAINPQNERWYREKLRKDLGMAAYAMKILPRIQQEIKNKKNLIVLDGLYSWEEYLVLKKKYPSLILLCVYAKPKIRYRRLQEREIRKFTPKQSKERDIAELINLNKGGPIAMADYLVKNEGSLKMLEAKLKKIFQLINE